MSETTEIPLTIQLAEVFHSIQGEGMRIGRPSWFLRTTGCNLRCPWCDTPFTSHNPESDQFDTAELIEKIWNSDTEDVVITGGEPMLSIRTVKMLLDELAPRKFITIETNGTIYPGDEIMPDLWSVSPKLTNSIPPIGHPGRENHLKANEPKISKFVEEAENYGNHVQFKFVAGNHEDLAEIKNYVERCDINPRDVWIMPEGTTAHDVTYKSPGIVEFCEREGLNFTTRLHVLLWGNKRGV